MTELLYRAETFVLIGACYEVYNHMGFGFVEAVYQECLEIEFRQRRVPVLVQPLIELHYKDARLEQTYRPDFTCYEKIVLEIKSVSEITDQHRSQVHNYLKATRFRLGLLMNFGAHPKLDYERIIR